MRLLLAVLLLSPSFAMANAASSGRSIVPCVEKKGSKWVIKKNTQCGQVTRGWLIDNNNRLIRLKDYQKNYAKQKSIEMKALEGRVKSWQTAANTCELQFTNQKTISLQFKGMSENWQQAYTSLKKFKAPKPSWTRSPALWFGVGVAAAALVVGASVAIYVAIKPFNVVVQNKALSIPIMPTVRRFQAKVKFRPLPQSHMFLAHAR